MSDVVPWVIGVAVTASLLYRWRDIRLDFWRLDLHLLPLNVAVIAAIGALIYASITLVELPGALTWSWVQALTGQRANIYLTPMTLPLYGWLFFVLLMLRLPDFATWEEHMFRKGALDVRDAFWANLAFGAVHFLFGVPVFVCAILALVGWVFTLVYWHRGLDRAARLHFQHNAILVTIAFVLVLT